MVRIKANYDLRYILLITLNSYHKWERPCELSDFVICIVDIIDEI
jgi:hypothetical protein